MFVLMIRSKLSLGDAGIGCATKPSLGGYTPRPLRKRWQNEPWHRLKTSEKKMYKCWPKGFVCWVLSKLRHIDRYISPTPSNPFNIYSKIQISQG